METTRAAVCSQTPFLVSSVLQTGLLSIHLDMFSKQFGHFITFYSSVFFVDLDLYMYKLFKTTTVMCHLIIAQLAINLIGSTDEDITGKSNGNGDCFCFFYKQAVMHKAQGCIQREHVT